MVRNEHRVRTDRLHHHGLQDELGSTRRYIHPISVLYFASLSEPRMDFQPWIWILLEETADAARLCAGEILTHHPPSRQVDRKLRRNRISTLAPLGNDEVVFAIRMKRAPIFKQP